MGVLFAEAFTQQALLTAWDQVRDAALEDGLADAAVSAFEVDAALRIAMMAKALAEGKWEPSAVRRVEIPKPSGGIRVLGIPVLADRVVERALLAVLDPVIDPVLLPWSFAYRRGMGVRDAVAALVEARDAGAGWVARADVKDCFARIPQWEVMRRLRDVVNDERVVHLVGMLLDRETSGGRRDPQDRGRGLHQGSVLSPLLSNLHLNTLDRVGSVPIWRVALGCSIGVRSPCSAPASASGVRGWPHAEDVGAGRMGFMQGSVWGRCRPGWRGRGPGSGWW